MTKENWEEFEQDLKKFKLVEEGYLELHTDFEKSEQDKDQDRLCYDRVYGFLETI